jgi:hypothetical protein
MYVIYVIYVLVKIPHCDSAKNRKFGTTIHAQPLIKKNLKISQCYVTMTYNTVFFSSKSVRYRDKKN